MLFSRNKTYQKTPSSAAKKSLLERLVILDADSIDSPEAVAEKLEEEDATVEAKVVRGRTFSPGRSMIDVSPERTIDPREFEMPKREEFPQEQEYRDIPARPLNIVRFEDAVSSIDEEESEAEHPNASEEEEKEDDVESIQISVHDASEDRPKTSFDVLERAREQEAEAEKRNEQVRIIYRVPKGTYGAATNRNAIHNELIERINNSIGQTAFAEPEAEEEYHAREDDGMPNGSMQSEAEQEVEPSVDVVAEVQSLAGEEVSQDHIQAIIEGALTEAVRTGELESGTEGESDEGDAGLRWVSKVEDADDMPRMSHFNKVLFPEEYFYANDGTVIKTVHQLRDALANMHEDTYKHHAVSRGTNDFANWIEGVYGHADCARRMKATGGKEDMLTILELYLQ